MKNPGFYKQIVDDAPFGFAHHEIIVDKDGQPCDYRFIDVNKAFEKLTGLSKDTLIGHTIRQLVPGIDQDDFDWIGYYGKIALEGGEGELDRYSQPFGKWYKVQVFSTEKMFFTTFFNDISAEKRAEQSRLKEKQILQNYLDTTETIMVSLDNSGNITMLNRYGLELLGYSAEQIIGKNWFETVLPQPEGKNVVLPVFRRIINGDLESLKDFENDIITSSGKRRSIAWRNGYQFDDAGHISGTLSSGIDITERRKILDDLRAEKEFMDATIASMHDGFSILNPEGIHHEVNAALCQMTGFSSEELLGVGPPHPYWPPEKYSEIIEAFQSTLKGDFSDFELTFMRRDGTRFPVIVSPSWIKDSHGNITSYLASVKDISTRKQAEEALRESEIRFSTIFRDNPAPLAITRFDNNQLADINLAWEQATGFTRDEAIGNTPAALNIWVNPDERNQMISEILTKGKSRLEVQVRCKSGEIRDMLMSAEKIVLSGQDYLLSMAQDITKRRKAENALLVSERHAHALIAAIPDMIFRMNTDGVFLDYKAAKEDLYLTPELFLGKKVSAVMPGWFAQLTLDYIAKTLTSGEISIFEYALVLHEKGETHFECRMVPYSGNEVLAIVRNISERKEFERKIRESEANARAVMESTNDLFILLDNHGVVIDCNEAHAGRLNMTRNEIIGKNVFDYLPPDIANSRKALVNKVLETGLPATGEDYRAGHWNEFVINPVYDQESKVDRVAVFSRDVTAKRQFIELLEEKNKTLMESEERFRRLFEDSSLGIALVGKDFHFIRANLVFCSMMGISQDDLKTLTFKDITHRDNITGDMEGIRKLMSGESQVYKTEKKYIRKDKTIVWANANISVIRNQTGEFLYFLAIIEDITQRKQAELLIKNSEEKYRTLYENMSQGVFYQTADGKITDTNDAALKMLGLTRDQFLGKDSFDSRWKVINENNEIIPPEKHPTMIALSTGKPVINQTVGVFIPETGKFNWVIINAIPQYRPGEDNPYQVFASMQDITRRKMAEDALKISEDRLSKTMIAANDGIWDWDLKTGYVYFDPRYYTMAGYEVNEFPHQFDEFRNRVHPDDIDMVINDSKMHLTGLSERFQNEFRFRKKDGQYMWILGRGSIVERDEKGAPIRFVGTHRDISELKQIKIIDDCRLRLLLFAETHSMPELLEETLNEAEKLTDSRIGFYHFIKDDQVTIHLQNWSTQTKASYCKAEGHNSEYNLNQAGVWTDCIKELKPVVHNDYATLPHRKGLPEGHAEVIRELVIPVMRGKKITAILGVGNKPTNYTQQDLEIVVKLADLAWDIAERKLSAEALEKSELFLKELNATKDKFFSIIAHDLKSPFNSIVGFSDLLKEDARNLDVKDIEYYASIINSAANQTLQLLDNLLHWARMQQGRMDFEPHNLLLREITSEVFDLLTEAAHQKNILMKNSIPEMVIIKADENMTKTTIRNLVSNALKFTRPGGSVEISAKFTDSEILVSVSDTGIGISKENIGKLFDIGSSYTTRGTGNEKGTGLGLILCKEFVEKHGGRIWVESAIGKGSRFTFSLPFTLQS